MGRADAGFGHHFEEGVVIVGPVEKLSIPRVSPIENMIGVTS